MISAVGERDDALARELGATPVRYGAGVAGRVRALGAVDAVFDAAGQGVLADAIALAGGPEAGHHPVRPGRRRLRRHAVGAHARPRSRRPR